MMTRCVVTVIKMVLEIPTAIPVRSIDEQNVQTCCNTVRRPACRSVNHIEFVPSELFIKGCSGNSIAASGNQQSRRSILVRDLRASVTFRGLIMRC